MEGANRIHLYVAYHRKNTYTNTRIEIIGNSQDPSSQISQIDVQSQPAYVRSLNVFYTIKNI